MNAGESPKSLTRPRAKAAVSLRLLAQSHTNLSTSLVLPTCTSSLRGPQGVTQQAEVGLL